MKNHTSSTTVSSMAQVCLLILTFSVLANAQKGVTATFRQRSLAVAGRAGDDKRSLGELHNEGVRYVLRKIAQGLKRNDEKRVIIALTKDYLQTIGDPSSDINVPDGFKSYDQAIGLIEDIQASETLKDAFKSLIKLSRENPTLSDLNRALINLERETAPRLSRAELKRLSDTISVVRSSAKFWAPTKQGGENGVRYVKSKGGLNGTPSELPWWGWDAVGFMIGNLGGAIACSVLSAA